MTETPDIPGTEDPATERLRLDLADLRFENARLKASIAERQAEILALSERLAALQVRLVSINRITAGLGLTRRLGSWRWLVRGR